MKLRSTSANPIIHTIWKFLERQYFRWGSHLIQWDFWVVWIQWTQLSYTRQHYTNHNQQSIFVENKTMYLSGSIIQNIPHPIQKCCIWYLVHIKIWMDLIPYSQNKSLRSFDISWLELFSANRTQHSLGVPMNSWNKLLQPDLKWKGKNWYLYLRRNFMDYEKITIWLKKSDGNCNFVIQNIMQ